MCWTRKKYDRNFFDLKRERKKGNLVFFLLELIQASNVSIDMIDRSLPAESRVCSSKDF